MHRARASRARRFSGSAVLGLAILELGYSRARMFSGLVILALGYSRAWLFSRSVILGLGYSRARLFPGSVILGLGHSRARLFPLSKILDTVIHIVAALVIDNTHSALSITNAATI